MEKFLTSLGAKYGVTFKENKGWFLAKRNVAFFVEGGEPNASFRPREYSVTQLFFR